MMRDDIYCVLPEDHAGDCATAADEPPAPRRSSRDRAKIDAAIEARWVKGLET